MGVSLYDNFNPADAEKRLFVAIILQAMLDTRSNSQKPIEVFAKQEAINWFMSRNRDFIEICLLADLNPDYVARKAKNAIKNPIKLRAEAGKGSYYEERKRYRTIKNFSKKPTKSQEG